MYKEDFKPVTSSNGYVLNAVNDVPDIRDRMYQPALRQLSSDMIPEDDLTIFNQGGEGSCTGHGLAAVINLLLKRKGETKKVSRRMLYEMAKKHDRWPGENYQGSSCRGAIRGWFHMGVCDEEIWPYESGSNDSYLDADRAKDARNITLGAYYRLNHDIVDFHSALNEVGALYVSADVHSGWMERIKGPDYEISLKDDMLGGHAFAIVGYNERGFWVQNSWSEGWAKNGVALWTYEDWQTHIKDAWVVRLAVPTPQIYRSSMGLYHGSSSADGSGPKGVNRIEIAGHYAHIDDGKFSDRDKFWSDKNDVDITSTKLKKSDKYDHLLLYCHGGLNSPGDSARRVKAMTPVFKENRIYNYHFMYDTGLIEELKDIIFRKKPDIKERVGFKLKDMTDLLVEKSTHHLGRALWSEMKKDAKIPFNNNNAGTYVVDKLVSEAFAKGLKIHIVGHSNGSVMVAYLLKRLLDDVSGIEISTLNLMAPACTMSLFKSKYAEYVSAGNIRNTTVYNLSKKLEKKDNVAKIYQKSLLYLVSNSYESDKKAPLLGMEKYQNRIDASELGNDFQFVISHGKKDSGSRSASKSHGGFDNDPFTLNDILKQITKTEKPERLFKKTDLGY